VARRLDEYNFSKRQGRLKYPWHRWTDGQPWEITQGQDYTCTSGSLSVYLYHKARELGCDGVKVSVVRGTGRRRDRIYFQFIYASQDEAPDTEPVRRKLKRKAGTHGDR
jgi:hypothetical protein